MESATNCKTPYFVCPLLGSHTWLSELNCTEHYERRGTVRTQCPGMAQRKSDFFVDECTARCLSWQWAQRALDPNVIFFSFWIIALRLSVLYCSLVGITFTVLEWLISLFVYRILWFCMVNAWLGAGLTWKVATSFNNERQMARRARHSASAGGGRATSRKSRRSESVSK